MKDQILFQLGLTVFYVATLLYYTRIYRKLLKREREVYKKVFEETLDIYSENEIRRFQRAHLLQVSDWAHARRTHGLLMGLPYIVPQNVLSSIEPIDVTKYFTDEEAEAVITGLEIFSKDRRTAHLCSHFVVKT